MTLNLKPLLTFVDGGVYGLNLILVGGLGGISTFCYNKKSYVDVDIISFNKTNNNEDKLEKQ